METGLALTADMTLVLGLIVFTVLMLAVEWIRADIVALLVLVVLGITRIVPTNQLFSGFAGDAVMAILATMILGAGLDRTGVLNSAASFILRLSKGDERKLLIYLCGITGLISAFMQNPAVAALFVPVASRISSRTGLNLSYLLVPMAVCIILGGTITMVGNSPQILLNDLLGSVNRNLPLGANTIEQFKVFAPAPIGFALLFLGLGYFYRYANQLLPPRENERNVTPASTENYFESSYGIKGEMVELKVTAASPLIGMSVSEVEAQAEAPLILAYLHGEEKRFAPPGDQIIFVGAILGVLGSRERATQFASENSLIVLAESDDHFAAFLDPSRSGISEAVIPPTSGYVGQRIGDLRLRKRHHIAVLALNRNAKVIREDIRGIIIRGGDTLVLHSAWRDLTNAADEKNFVVVTDYPKEEERPHRIPHALFFFILAMCLALFSDLKLPVALLTGAIGMLLTGVINMDEAYQSISWKTIFLMAALIPLGWAVDSTGTAAWIAGELMETLDGVPIWGLQLAVALLTSAFASVMSNVGATVVMVPMSVNIAIAANANPVAFAMLVALSASNSFVSVSNPVLAIATGAAGFRSRDLWRIGTPISIGYLIVVIVMVNLVFGYSQSG